MHRPTLIINLSNNCCWIVYGLTKGNTYLVVWLVPTITSIFNLIFLSLTFIYPVQKGEERVWTYSDKSMIPVLGITKSNKSVDISIEDGYESEILLSGSETESIYGGSENGTETSTTTQGRRRSNSEIDFVPANQVVENRVGVGLGLGLGGVGIGGISSGIAINGNASAEMTSPYFQQAPLRNRSNSGGSNTSNTNAYSSSVPAGFAVSGFITVPIPKYRSGDGDQTQEPVSHSQFFHDISDDTNTNTNEKGIDLPEIHDPLAARILNPISFGPHKPNVVVLTRTVYAPTLVETLKEAVTEDRDGFDPEVLGMEILYGRAKSLTMSLNPFETRERVLDAKPLVAEPESALLNNSSSQSLSLSRDNHNDDIEFATLGGPLGPVHENHELEQGEEDEEEGEGQGEGKGKGKGERASDSFGSKENLLQV